MPTKQNLRRILIATVVACAVFGLAWAIGVYNADAIDPHPFFSNLEGPRPVVVSEAGGRGLWPENTLAAIRGSLTLGVELITLDVRITRDGVPVLMRDDRVDRTTDGTGLVSELSSRSMGDLDAGFGFDSSEAEMPLFVGLGIGVPSLEDVFRAFDRTQFLLFLRGGEDQLAETVGELIEQFGRSDRTIVFSETDAIIDFFRAQFSGVATVSTPSELRRFTLLNSVFSSRAYTPQAEFLLVDTASLNTIPGPRFISNAQRQGMRVAAVSSGDQNQVKLLADRGVDLIITPYPDVALAALKRL
ncbi:MAG: hypothetical protein EA383_12295 [Spirochaetaceae bacterium]|nr:MAG: hypothetical protein EA383_12295 [Spirochaetaceae bacterium]